MLQIMGAFASYLDLPDGRRGRTGAVPTPAFPPQEGRQDRVRIHSGKDKPATTYAAVQYRDSWFWIDDGDWQTKRALTAIVFFFTLADTSAAQNLPLITIPAQ